MHWLPKSWSGCARRSSPVVEKVSAALKPETVKLFNEELERVRKAK